MKPRLVGLVADDLTGATDSAVQFATHGWSAHLLRGDSPDFATPDSSATVLAVATGVRAAADDDAERITRNAVRRLVDRGCDRLFVKVDSTVRGSVVGQIRGAVAAWGISRHGAVAVLCPAFPAQERTVQDGRVLIRGVPVDRTAAADDPVTPVRESLLSKLVPGAVTAAAADLGPTLLARLGPEAVICADAATDADLDAVADGVLRIGDLAFAVGSAGLAAAVARRWATPGAAANPTELDLPHWQAEPRILLASSSLHPVTLAALNRLREAINTSTPRNLPIVDILTTPADRRSPQEVAARFGREVAARVRSSPYDALILIGGDGAASALDQLAADAVTLHTAIAPGVPLGIVRGGPADGLPVVTKSGGFGDADSLVQLVHLITSHTEG